MVTAYEIVIGYIVCSINPMYFMMMFLSLFQIKYYIISENRELTSSILRKIAPNIISPFVKHVDKDVPFGYFVGTRYMGFIKDNEVHLLTYPSMYKELIYMPCVFMQTSIPVQEASITVYVRKGTYKNLYYTPIKMDLSHISPLGDQGDILKNIVDIYQKQGRATVFLHGVTGAGKSTMGYLLAKELKGFYCHTFNPTDPGDQLSTLIVDVQRDDEPLILVMEEVDTMIQSIHQNKYEKHLEIPISVYNKSTWSSFLDDMIFYKKVILVLTSNTSKEDVDVWDESYLREGRIHASYSMKTKLTLSYE
uniref:ATPase AAA-type core domain-containing protein n=1 Tax=viral metagenome TaxID=1070528 RepID=A0A6C0HXA1_9ZZZZ